MILSLIGEEPDLVRTESTSILQRDIADTATVHLEFTSGLKAHISVSWFHPYKEQKLVVVGKFGMAVFDDTKPWEEKLALYDYEVVSSQSSINLKKSYVSAFLNLASNTITNAS